MLCTCNGGEVWTDPLGREERTPWSSARGCTLPRDGEEVRQSRELHMSSCRSNQAAQHNGGKYPPMCFHLHRIFRPNSIMDKERAMLLSSFSPLTWQPEAQVPGPTSLGGHVIQVWCPSSSTAQVCLARNIAGTRPVGQKGRKPVPVGPWEPCGQAISPTPSPTQEAVVGLMTGAALCRSCPARYTDAPEGSNWRKRAAHYE